MLKLDYLLTAPMFLYLQHHHLNLKRNHEDIVKK